MKNINRKIKMGVARSFGFEFNRLGLCKQFIVEVCDDQPFGDKINEIISHIKLLTNIMYI